MHKEAGFLQPTSSNLPPKKGWLISFDGLDSSGKATQAKKLAERLKAAGWIVHEFATPDYATPSGQELKARLQNKKGTWSRIPWREKMTYFAANRAEHRNEVIAAIQNGDIVIYDRYVPSSLAFIAAEARAAGKQHVSRQEAYETVEAEEYGKNKMPREDISFFLDVPPSISTGLLEHRKHELHDQAEYTDHVEVQQVLYQEYQHLCAADKKRCVTIPCAPGGKLLSLDAIAALIWTQLIRRYPLLARKQD